MKNAEMEKTESTLEMGINKAKDVLVNIYTSKEKSATTIREAIKNISSFVKANEYDNIADFIKVEFDDKEAKKLLEKKAKLEEFLNSNPAITIIAPKEKKEIKKSDAKKPDAKKPDAKKVDAKKPAKKVVKRAKVETGREKTVKAPVISNKNVYAKKDALVKLLTSSKPVMHQTPICIISLKLTPKKQQHLAVFGCMEIKLFNQYTKKYLICIDFDEYSDNNEPIYESAQTVNVYADNINIDTLILSEGTDYKIVSIM